MSKTFLEITDLPTDKLNSLHRLRPMLVDVYNNARGSKEKMALLKQTLKFVYTKCTDFEKALAALDELNKPAEKTATQSVETDKK